MLSDKNFNRGRILSFALAALVLIISARIPAASGSQQKQQVTFLGRTYHLASFNQKSNPTWEFSSASETVNNWTTLLTIIDRPDARTRPDLDRLAQGVLDNYKSHGGHILMAKTMLDASGAGYNYTVVAFDQAAEHRFELSFVKAALGPKNAYIVVYGVHVADPHDYTAKAKAYLNEHSDEVGRELAKIRLPEFGTLLRKEF